MQWRKIFDFNPAFPILCDKIAVRDFIAARVGREHLIPLIWSGLPAEIPFDRVSRPFFLKSTHASGQVIMVGRDADPDIAAIRAQAEAWLALNYGADRDQPGYGPVPARLMIEETIATDEGARPNEIRLFVFNGKVAVINTVFVEDGQIRSGAFHTPDWTRLNWHFTRRVEQSFPRPIRLRDMIALAERVGEGFDHLRVDFYDCGERIWIGELTVYSWSGYSRFNPDEADLELGAYWRMPKLRWRAILAMLVRGRSFPLGEGA
jgi:teichuronopeptide biosynthesis TupA-like protein